MIGWYHLLWIVPLTIVLSAEITSWYERKYKYNLTDLEKDALRQLGQRSAGYLASGLGKLKELL